MLMVCDAIMDEHAFVTQGSVFNEALARSTINRILISCIAEEKRHADSQESQINWILSAQWPSRHITPALDSISLFLQFDTKLNFLVTFKKEKRMLEGFADYSLWYEQYEPMGTNLLFCTGQKEGCAYYSGGSAGSIYGWIIHILWLTVIMFSEAKYK